MDKATQTGTLYMIPTTLGDNEPMQVLPQAVKDTIHRLDIFIVENEKTVRKFIKRIAPEKKQSELVLFPLNKHTDPATHKQYIQPLLEGKDVGVISEAGCPGIADPGAAIVELAHKQNIRVLPLVGPSSILLALMASGMNGQSFAFNGYLPIDKNEKKAALKTFERLSFEKSQSQIFIETPYRNNQLLQDLIQTLHPNTLVCIACDITLESEFIQTKPISAWKRTTIDLHKRPCIFILHKN